MFQNLLIERFALKFHSDQKEFQGYQRVLAKNGPKFQESGPEPAKETPPPAGYPALLPGLTGMAQWLRTSIQKFTDLDNRVEKRKITLPIVIIDHAEKRPTEN